MRYLLQDLPQSLQNSHHSLTDDMFWVLSSNGAADLNDNVIFFGFKKGNIKPSLVAKIPRLPENGRFLQAEYDCLMELWDFMGREATRCLPEPLAFFQWNRQSVLISSYVEGDGLLHLTNKELLQDPERTLVLFQDVARSLRELHIRASSPMDEKGQIPSDFLQKVEVFSKIYMLTDIERQALSELVIQYKKQTAHYKTMIQGDFWHGNVIRDKVNRNLIFIDWQHARWSTDVSLDVYLFLLASAVTMAQGSDKEKARVTMNVLRRWVTRIIPDYLANYGLTDRFSLLPAKYGMMLCCVEKAVRATMDFGYHQSDDLIWRNLFYEIANANVEGLFDDI